MAVLGVLGFLGIIVCIVMVVVSFIKKNKNIKLWAIGIGVSLIVTIAAAVNTPDENNTAANQTTAATTAQEVAENTTDAPTAISVSETTAAPTEETAAPTEKTAAEVKNISAGMYKVGSDIKAGEYLIYADSEISYFQVSKDSTGELDSIIANDTFSGTRYVTVKDGQYIEITNASMLPVDQAAVQEPQEGKYDAGMYKVGRDIKAGEYKVTPEIDPAYYEVTQNSAGDLDSIITNDNITAEKYVTIKDGQYIKLVGCYIVVK